jgi:hypothetical protein
MFIDYELVEFYFLFGNKKRKKRRKPQKILLTIQDTFSAIIGGYGTTSPSEFF